LPRLFQPLGTHAQFGPRLCLASQVIDGRARQSNGQTAGLEPASTSASARHHSFSRTGQKPTAVQDYILTTDFGREGALQGHQVQGRPNAYTGKTVRQHGENLPAIFQDSADNKVIRLRGPGYPGNGAVQNEVVTRLTRHKSRLQMLAGGGQLG